MTPTGHIHIGEAVLLEEHIEGRALWQGRPAYAHIVWPDSNRGQVFGVVAAISQAGGPHVDPLRIVGAAPGDERMVAVVEGDPGVGLGRLLSLLGERREGHFPVDVGCRLALWLASLSAWMPAMDALRITWSGTLRASPFPRFAAGGHALMRYLSPAEVRGTPSSQEAVAVYRAGIVLYELLAGGPPFTLGDSFIHTLGKIVAPERIPLGHRRVDLDVEVSTLIDELVAMVPTARSLDDVKAELLRHACSEAECARFLAGVVGDVFADDRGAELAFFEEAAILPTTASTRTIEIWREVATTPVSDIAAALRELNNRDGRTD
ncbi:MAG: hypothetical protein Q8O67_02980 [Deltaproteobacteria bacterium]|nr:hypothetical protein [Deltaproteobacteria bacterium]